METSLHGFVLFDEAHLLNIWGKSFRKAHQQIGWVHSRLQYVALLSLTATMRGGEYIENFLGLHENHFHLLRRSK